MGTDTSNTDTDGDSYLDLDEVQNGYNPLGAGKMAIDLNFATGHKGQVFLQVESAGELWYVNPKDNHRYLIPPAAEAINTLTQVGECISDADIHQLTIGLAIKDISLSSISTCYPPAPKVLGVTTLYHALVYQPICY